MRYTYINRVMFLKYKLYVLFFLKFMLNILIWENS